MKLAFVFPGQGSQTVGMLAGWAGNPAIDAAMQRASTALGQDLAPCRAGTCRRPQSHRQYAAGHAGM